MKKLITLLLFLSFASIAGACTNIATPIVSGHWTLSGSPYLIYNNITINPSFVLTIDPGVEVIFQGFYYISVYGDIVANGTAGNPISFHVNDTTGWADTAHSGGWSGITLNGSDFDTLSKLNFCNFYDAKINSAVFVYNRPMVIKNCNFFHNNTTVSVLIDSLCSFEMAFCNIYENYSPLSYICRFEGNDATSNCNIHDCKFHNNSSLMSNITSYYINMLFAHNTVNNNTQYEVSSGQAIMSISNGNALILCDSIYANISKISGAISTATCNIDINRNYICNNQTTQPATGCGMAEGGAAIRITAMSNPYPYALFATVRNNIIANNYAAVNGGALYVFASNATILNNQIVNNSAAAAGGIYVFNNSSFPYDTAVIIKNNIFYRNRSVYSSEDTMEVHGALDSTVTYEYDHNWTHNPFYKQSTYLAPYFRERIKFRGDTTTNIIGTEPGMVAPTFLSTVTESALTADFALRSTSRCIDRGDTTGISSILGSRDIAGNPRIFGRAIDIGAFENNSDIVRVLYAHGQTGGRTVYPNPGKSDPEVLEVSYEPDDVPAISVYPNPAMNLFFVSTPEAHGTIDILDISGKTVIEKQVITPLTYFDAQSLPRGLYIAAWHDGHGGTQVQKVIVQ